MAERGIDMIVRVSQTGAQGGTMLTIGGLRARSIRINDAPIDTTSADAASRWRRLITGGVRAVEISGGGVFEDDAAIEVIRGHIMDGATGSTLGYVEFTAPDWGLITGSFHISNLELSSSHDDEVTWSAEFASAGDVVWQAI